MLIDSIPSLMAALRRNRLLEPTQLDQLYGTQESYPNPKALAKDLLKRDWLTAYQVNLVFQGRGQDLVLGSYVLLERVGEGGMGQVFKARNWKLGQIVALKLIRKERLSHPDAIRRFQREIRAASQLSHSNIVRAYDADEIDGTHFFAMEYVEGSDLARLVKKRGPLPIAEACDYVRQAAQGLQHAYERGLVHRDIKPHNLLLTAGGVVKVLDMGLARVTETVDEGEKNSTMTQEGAVMGTPDYIAPEQALESHTADIRADLYSLGCTFYYLLTGRPPFAEGTFLQKINKHQFEEPVPVERLRPEVPPEVAAIVRQLMAKRPEERFQTPAQLSDMLVPGAPRFPDAAPSEPPHEFPATHASKLPSDQGWTSALTPPSATEVLASPRQRHARAEHRWRLWAAAAGTVLVASVVGLVILFLNQHAPSPSAKPAEEPPSMEDLAREALHKLILRNDYPGTDQQELRREVLAFTRAYPSTPQALRAADVLGRLPSPFDGLKRSRISPYEQAAAGAGDPKKAPPELVGILGHSRLKHWSNVTAVAFSPDAKELTSVSTDGMTILWDLTSGRQRHVLPEGRISADGRLLLTANPDGTGTLWDVTSGRQTQTLRVAGMLSPDGRTIASVEQDGNIALWSVAKDRMLWRLRSPVVPGVPKIFSLDSSTLATVAGDSVIVWDVATGALRRRLKAPGTVYLNISPDGQTLATIQYPKPGQAVGLLWDLASGKQQGSIKDGYAANGLVLFCPDGKSFVAPCGSRVYSFDLKTMKLKEELPLLNLGYTFALAFSPDGQKLVGGDSRGALMIWDLATKQNRGGIQLEESYRALALSADGQTVAGGSSSGAITLWEATTGKVLRSLRGHLNEVLFLAFTPDGKRLVSAANHPDCSFKIWDLATGKIRRSIRLQGVPDSLAISPDGRSIAYHAGPNGLHFWDLWRDIEERSFPGISDRVVFRPDWKVLAEVNASAIKLRSVATGEELGTIEVEAYRAPGLTFSPDGKLLASAHFWIDIGTEFRDLNSRGPPQTYRGVNKNINTVAFHPDGTMMASAGAANGNVSFWDLHNQKGDMTPRGSLRVGPPGALIQQVMYSHDGRYLLTVNGNETIYVLRLHGPN